MIAYEREGLVISFVTDQCWMCEAIKGTYFLMNGSGDILEADKAVMVPHISYDLNLSALKKYNNVTPESDSTLKRYEEEYTFFCARFPTHCDSSASGCIYAGRCWFENGTIYRLALVNSELYDYSTPKPNE